MKRRNNIAVFTVIFQENAPYFDDFIQSLKQQTISDFDLVIMNDGVDNIPKEFDDLTTLLFPAESSMAKTRESGINKLIDLDYQHIIFADSDDMLMNNRVEVSVQLLEKYDLLANDLDLIDENGVLIYEGFWRERIAEQSQIDRKFLKDQNIFGLGNSAVSGNVLHSFRIPEELEVIDWFVFLQLIKEEYHAVFTSLTRTLYRQHSKNIGAAGRVTEKSLRRTLEVKNIYYKLLSGQTEEFSKRYARICSLIKKFEDVTFFNDYLKEAQQAIENPFWWEDVK